jgi:2-dehydro-3-deoxyphosphogalactonate aldolase
MPLTHKASVSPDRAVRYDVGMLLPESPLRATLRQSPLIAILRGITSQEAPEMGRRLWEAGFQIMEVPLNAPQAFESIGLLREAAPQALIAAGRVLCTAHVSEAKSAGAQLVMAPNLDADVARAVLDAQLEYVPGVATPSEAFSALTLGAQALKMFPAEMISPAVLKAMRAVLPADALLIPEGGINTSNMFAYWQAGASGFGIGGTLYQSNKQHTDVYLDAIHLVALGASLIKARGAKSS